MKKLLLRAADGVSIMLYPPKCPVCDEILSGGVKDFLDDEKIKGVNAWICDTCRDNLSIIKSPICLKCGQSIDDKRVQYCADCARYEHSFDEGRALWNFSLDARRILLKFKYASRRDYGYFISKELYNHYAHWIKSKSIDCIIPIPISKKRYRQRGYNQAQLIARPLGKMLGIPVRSDILLRKKNTIRQKELSRVQRKNNLKNAFFISQDVVNLRGVLLIDDIFTTGSTLDAAAEILKCGGVHSVYTLCAGAGKNT